jgi:hypothetical protein
MTFETKALYIYHPELFFLTKPKALYMYHPETKKGRHCMYTIRRQLKKAYPLITNKIINKSK